MLWSQKSLSFCVLSHDGNGGFTRLTPGRPELIRLGMNGQILWDLCFGEFVMVFVLQSTAWG